MSRLKNSRGVVSILMIIIGILLIIWPGHTLSLLSAIVGWGLVIGGVVGVGFGLVSFNPFNLISGIIAIIVGAVFIRAPFISMSIIPVIIGILIILNGAHNLYNAWIGRHAMGYNPRRDLILSIIMVILGILIVIFPFTTASAAVVVIGVILLYNGITNLITRGREKRR